MPKDQIKEKKQAQTTTENSHKNGVDTARLKETINIVKADPQMGQCKFRATNKWIEGGHNRARIREFYGAKQEDSSRTHAFYFDMDEPPILAGENRGANPVEVALSALSGCLITTLVYYAALMDVKVNNASLELEGDIDLQGLFGLKQDVRPGYQQIRLKFHLDTDGSPEQEQILIELAQKHSPVFNTINQPVDIQVV